jgi:hypothetical protein
VGGLNDTYFAYANMLEFLFFIFIRTRLSLKYFAKIATMLNVLFLVYLNSYLYSAQFQMLNFVAASTALTFVTFIKIAEIPAMQTWNPFDENTPNSNHPRIGYTHVINDSNYGTGVLIWQAFQPLQQRESFTLLEQAEGDRLSEFARYFLSYSLRS